MKHSRAPSAVRKLLVIVGLFIASNILQCFGFPWRFDAWWVDSAAAWPMTVLTGLGLVGLIAPYCDRLTRPITARVLAVCAGIAFCVLLAVVCLFTAPIAKVIWVELAFIYAWTSLTGAFAFVATGASRILFAHAVFIRYVPRGEVADAIAQPVAPPARRAKERLRADLCE